MESKLIKIKGRGTDQSGTFVIKVSSPTCPQRPIGKSLCHRTASLVHMGHFPSPHEDNKHSEVKPQKSIISSEIQMPLHTELNPRWQ